MRAVLRALALAYAAGSAAALVEAGLLGALADAGLPQAARATGATLAPTGLAVALVRGGLFGLALALPWPAGRWVRRGLLLALAPAAWQLLVVLSWREGAGPLGLGLGLATPFLVLAAKALWGVVASGLARSVGS